MTINIATVDHGLESRHRALWALGDYTTVATELVSPLGPALVQASGIGAGDRALVAVDVLVRALVPELLERGAALAQARGFNLQWCEANAEALPFGAGEFD